MVQQSIANYTHHQTKDAVLILFFFLFFSKWDNIAPLYNEQQKLFHWIAMLQSWLIPNNILPKNMKILSFFCICVGELRHDPGNSLKLTIFINVTFAANKKENSVLIGWTEVHLNCKLSRLTSDFLFSFFLTNFSTPWSTATDSVRFE